MYGVSMYDPRNREQARPTRKWGVLAYIVAEQPPGFPSGQSLEPNAREEVQAIVRAGAQYLKEMHVAYQVDYGDTSGIFRCVVDGPAPEEEKIPEDPGSEPGDPSVVTDFFKSAIRECPAERYAVFFWGHSFGPVSLFSPPLPRQRTLGLPELRGVLSYFKSAGHELDVVLFRDCWMSTLETAYELKDVTRFIIASQALVPIGGVWPYKDLFEELIDHESANESALVAQLGHFYNIPENRGQDPTVPFALLDLEKLDQTTRSVNKLVRALQGLTSASRRAAIEQASMGNIALVDVRTLCANLQRPGFAKVSGAAKDLDHAVNNLVVEHYPQSSDFLGVSVFYYPSPNRRNASPGDRYIWPLLPFSHYTEFKLSTATKWGNDVAFEQLNPRNL